MPQRARPRPLPQVKASRLSHRWQAAPPPAFETASTTPLPAPQIVEGAAYITDGDTLTLCKTQVRLFGVDAPELDHPYGKKARWALVKLCKGHKVRAEIREKDAYGRTVAL